jgi:tyrosyl-tRNA synthetase
MTFNTTLDRKLVKGKYGITFFFLGLQAAPEKRAAQKVLAEQMTTLVHGRKYRSRKQQLSDSYST